ncbi:MAG TPA: hypothetical protein VE287_01820, partial [Actinopolymorphaceae bacterium]|nr:hypothetical protein [Actinopolymorphaceae bacterium]
MASFHRQLNRRRLLQLGATGLVGAAGIVAARPTPAYACTNAPDVGLAPGNSPATNRANLVAALAGSTGCITFPPGDYLIDNSGSYIVVNGFAGDLTMQPGARFVFTDKTTRGLNFEGGTGAAFHGLVATFTSPLPAARVGSEECIIFLHTTDTLVEDVDINGSAAAGLMFFECVRPTALRVNVGNTMADGLHFANCQDGYADQVTTNNTGDDGVAFVNYDSGPDYTGGWASNITVTNSHARGVSVVGQSDVTIDHFGVNWSAVSGIYCAYESSYRTRVPTNVTFQNGFAYNGGALSGGSGNTFGLEYANVGEIFYNNVVLRTPGTRGASGTARAFTRTHADGSTEPVPAGTVHLTGVSVENAPASGFDVQGGTHLLDTLSVSGSNQGGFYAGFCDSVEYVTMTVTNASKTDPLHRAFAFEKNT